MKERKAYAAMYHFLDERYKRLPSDALGQLLGEMNLNLWEQSEPADLAINAEWERAVSLAEHDAANTTEQPSILRRAS